MYQSSLDQIINQKATNQQTAPSTVPPIVMEHLDISNLARTFCDILLESDYLDIMIGLKQSDSRNEHEITVKWDSNLHKTERSGLRFFTFN